MTKQRTDKKNSKAPVPPAELSDTELEKVAGAGDKNAHDFPTETVSLNYGEIAWAYTQQKE